MLLSGLMLLAATLTGTAAGLAAAAFALALAGQSLFDAPPDRARLALVAGPLLGLLPLSGLALAAGRRRDLGRAAVAGAALWLAAATVSAYWFGVRPLLR
jgi:hypothetical protein